jgi:hypothetical protein
MSEQYTDLLKALNDQYEVNKIDIYIPSCGRKVQFKPLSLKQQKDLISKMTDLSHANLDFNITTNDMIRENCCEDIDILAIDKAAILLAYRGQFGRDTMKHVEDGEEYSIPIKEHVKKFDSFKFDNSLRTHQKSAHGIVVDLEIPNIALENKINKFIKKKTPKSSNIEDLYKIIGDLYVYEIIKYITRIQIGEFEVKFKDLLFDQQLKICYTLPLSVSQELLEYITEIKNFEEQFTSVIIDGKKINITLSHTIFAAD